MVPGKIRPLAIGIFRRNQEILVFEGYDPTKKEVFYRPLGGAIEFGEHGHQALVREIYEEIGATVNDVRFVGVLENIFVYDGRPGHEIVLVYEGRLSPRDIYEQEYISAREDDGSPLKVVWRSLSAFGGDSGPLYPTGLLDMLADSGT
jgi:8-oxo-dGTP pyrophosphatase MutT (NUDIX family)